MAFEALINDEPEQAPEPEKPDPITQLGSTLASQFAGLSDQINQAYQQNKGIASQPPQVQYVPYPINQPQEPEYGEADILADLPGALERIQAQAVQQAEERVRNEVGTHLAGLYEKDFERDLKDLSQHPYYKFVGEDLKEHFKMNPNERFSPGRLQEKFNALVGEHLPEIREAEQRDAEANTPARVRSVDHSIPVSSSPAPPSSPKEEITLSDQEERLRQHANKYYGTNISKAEWAADQRGELFPTDWNDDMRDV